MHSFHLSQKRSEDLFLQRHNMGIFTVMDYLRKQGFPDEIIEGVLSVTKREGESYDEFVRRAAESPLGKEF